MGDFGDMLREKEIIRTIQQELVKPQHIGGYDDDACYIDVGGDTYLLLTVDSQSEGKDFIREDPGYWIGWYAVAASLSDIAAMGGQPIAAVADWRIPFDIDLEFVKQISKGMNDIAVKHSCYVAGGDLDNVSTELSLSVTVLGQVKKREILLRSRAQVGDSIGLMGTLAIPISKSVLAGSIDRTDFFLQAQPMVKEGRFLAQSGFVNSCVDLSDGLYWAISEICSTSKKGCLIYESNLPFDETGQSALQKLKISYEELGMCVLSDLLLLFTVRAGAWNAFAELAHTNGFVPHCIGEIIGTEERLIKKSTGKISALSKPKLFPWE